MPRKNIYIRNEDEALWKSIEDKPAWIHEHLNNNRLTDAGKCPGHSNRIYCGREGCKYACTYKTW